MELTRRQEELIERGVVALERMAEDPVINVEVGPPVCPHCETVNPEIRMEEAEGSGKLSEFVVQGHCLSCNKIFYAIPDHWTTAKNSEHARELLEEKLTTSGYD
jgi:hypothetical protein